MWKLTHILWVELDVKHYCAMLEDKSIQNLTVASQGFNHPGITMYKQKSILKRLNESMTTLVDHAHVLLSENLQKISSLKICSAKKSISDQRAVNNFVGHRSSAEVLKSTKTNQ